MGLTVDIVIPTVGRATLEQSILAALAQTYPECRVVVVGDGPQFEAPQIFERATADRDRPCIYAETPQRIGFGDGVIQWWIESGRAGDCIRSLDDDDWMPPVAVDDMMAELEADPANVMVACQMMITVARLGRVSRWRIQEPVMVEGKIGNGSVLYRTGSASGAPAVFVPNCDFYRLKYIADKGRLAIVDRPLYWYLAYRGAKERLAVARALGYAKD